MYGRQKPVTLGTGPGAHFETIQASCERYLGMGVKKVRPSRINNKKKQEAGCMILRSLEV